MRPIRKTAASTEFLVGRIKGDRQQAFVVGAEFRRDPVWIASVATT